MNTNEIFRDNLRHLMEEKGLTAYRLHKMSGVSQSLIGAMLRAERSTSIAIVEKIAAALEVPPWLMLIEDARINGTQEEMERSAQMVQKLTPEDAAEVRNFLDYKIKS